MPTILRNDLLLDVILFGMATESTGLDGCA